MKKLILLLTLIIMSTLVLAANIDFEIDTNGRPVVENVPFDLKIMLNTNSVAIVDVELEAYLPSSFNFERVLSNNFNLEPTHSKKTSYGYHLITEGAKSSDKYWLSNDLREIINFKTSIVQSDGEKNIKFKNIKLVPVLGDIISVSNFNKVIDVRPSTCGDKVVGHLPDGTEEVCDADSEGCIDCKKIAMGYRAENCHFGSYNCTIIELTPVELFAEKVTALLNEECYHELYCDGGTSVVAGMTNVQKKFYQIAQVTAALNVFFSN